MKTTLPTYLFNILFPIKKEAIMPWAVSYTHLDVYKRQAGNSEGNMLCVWGIYGLSFISYFEIGELPEISRTGQARLYGVELSSQCFQSNLSVGKLWAHPLFLWQWPCRNGSNTANPKGVWCYPVDTGRLANLQLSLIHISIPTLNRQMRRCE